MACGVVTAADWLFIAVDAIEVAVTEVERTCGMDGRLNAGEGVFLLTCSVIASNAQVSIDLKWYLEETRAMSISRLRPSTST
jgi:hypothetical protein